MSTITRRIAPYCTITLKAPSRLSSEDWGLFKPSRAVTKHLNAGLSASIKLTKTVPLGKAIKPMQRAFATAPSGYGADDSEARRVVRDYFWAIYGCDIGDLL